MTELSEDQFKILKNMCESDVMLIFAPGPQDGDPEDKIEEYRKVREDLQNLIDNGFMMNITENFQDLLDDARLKGLRQFEVIGMTQLAYNMFSPKEGSIN